MFRGLLAHGRLVDGLKLSEIVELNLAAVKRQVVFEDHVHGGAARKLGVRAALLGAQPNGAQLAEIAKIIDSGKLAPIIDRILPLSEARRAHELSQSGHTHGKITMRVKNGDGTFERKQS